MEKRGSIANELYSEALQSSSVGLDRGTPAAHVHGNSYGNAQFYPAYVADTNGEGPNVNFIQKSSAVELLSFESDQSDLWYDDGSSCEDSVEKLDKTSDMDREWQKRRYQFHTIGYRDGLIAGKEAAAQEGFNIGFKDSVFIGYSWGLVRGISSAMASLPSGIREKLVEKEETRDKFKHLHESVQSISTADALKIFHEEQQRKSANQESVDISDLESYSRELQSLLSKSPLIEGSLKVK